MLEQKRLVGAVRTCVVSGLLVIVIADDGRNLDYRFEPGPGKRAWMR